MAGSQPAESTIRRAGFRNVYSEAQAKVAAQDRAYPPVFTVNIPIHGTYRTLVFVVVMALSVGIAKVTALLPQVIGLTLGSMAVALVCVAGNRVLAALASFFAERRYERSVRIQKIPSSLGGVLAFLAILYIYSLVLDSAQSNPLEALPLALAIAFGTFLIFQMRFVVSYDDPQRESLVQFEGGDLVLAPTPARADVLYTTLFSYLRNIAAVIAACSALVIAGRAPASIDQFYAELANIGLFLIVQALYVKTRRFLVNPDQPFLVVPRDIWASVKDVCLKAGTSAGVTAWLTLMARGLYVLWTGNGSDELFNTLNEWFAIGGVIGSILGFGWIIMVGLVDNARVMPIYPIPDSRVRRLARRGLDNPMPPA